MLTKTRIYTISWKRWKITLSFETKNTPKEPKTVIATLFEKEQYVNQTTKDGEI